MSVFKKNFLPSQSQPWARQVEDKLAEVEARFKTEVINNRTRDEQLQSSYNRLDQAVQQVTVTANQANTTANSLNTVINNIYSPGTTELNGAKVKDGTISIGKLVAGTITGDYINGGTITGVTIRSAASGQRVEMTNTEMNFYNSSSNTGKIIGSTEAGYNSIQMSSSNGYVVIANGSSTIFGGTQPNAFTVLAGNTQVNNGNFAVGDGTALFNNDVTIGGSPSLRAVISGTGTIQRTALIGGGTTTASFNDSGLLQRTSSSARYKTDIENLELSYEKILQLQPRKFRLKEEVESLGDNARYYAGFIAEEIADNTDLDIFVSNMKLEDGSFIPDGVYYGELTSALVSAIKTQHEMIKSLEARIENLESR